MEKKSNKLSIERKLCIFGYVIVPLFFVTLYFLMTETYEDIMQGNSESLLSVGGIFDKIYNYIPRLGEFYQHIAVHYMTPQISFGMDMLFRLITAIIASGVIYFSTTLILGRKPRIQYKDIIIYIGITLFLMASIFSEAFTYRFSYANNYVLGLFVALAFFTLFRLKIKDKGWWSLIGAWIIGFMFGISTELVPVAFLILLSVWLIAKLIRKEIALMDLFHKYKLQTIATIGLVIGLAFFYLGGGLNGRTGGGYAEVYDYVSLAGLIRSPLETGYKLLCHIWYNIRYIFFAIPLMGIYIFVEMSLFKKKNDYWFWQIMLSSFCILFVGATSLIAVHDDLYPRFMIPVFIAIALATGMFIIHVIDLAKISESIVRRSAFAVVAMGSLLFIDMTFAFTIYNVELATKLDAILYNPGGELIIQPVEGGYTMIPSPIFRLKQLPPFDWGSAADYAKFGL